ncbi:MAG: PAS domain S-box protein [Candidatus Aureabacteria bacterium]|nr:PAS domain S-box protein [Candidatus Auribacterota bacterium]
MDVTERKNSGEKVKQQAEEWELILNSISDFVFILDNESRIIKANTALISALHLKAEGVIGKKCYEILHKSDKPWPDCPHQKTLRDKKPHTEEVDDKNIGIPLLVTVSPIFDDKGEIAGTVHIAKDITELKKLEEEHGKMLLWQHGVSVLQHSLLAPALLDEKLRTITDGVVRLFDADFCRIWLIRPGDLCERDCIHAEVREGPHVCRYRDRCLHLVASSGRYTHLDGKAHHRVPFGCYKIGRIASGEDHKFLTNDVQHDPHVHNHEWARNLGLVSFAGYQLRVPGGEAIGVLSLFSKHPMRSAEDEMLDGLSSAVALVIQQSHAEEALRKSEEDMAITLHSIGDAVISVDTDGRIVRMNPVAEKMTGWTLLESKGSPLSNVFRIIDARTRQPSPDPVKRVLETAGIIGLSNDTMLIARDGTEYLIADSAAPIRDKDGRILGVVLVFHDVTEQYRMQVALRESESKYRNLFESSRDAIMIIEPPSWKFTSGNRATMEMFKARNAEEFSNLGPWDLSPERQPDGRASAEKAREMIQTAMREGSNYFEWTHKRLDGEEFPATVLLTRMEQDGKVIVQATVRDITTQKGMERRLMTAERLAAVGTFVAGAGHELNNPLACVIGFSQLALSKLGQDKFERKELRDALEKVASNADRCRAIVSSLLACGRGYSLQLAPVDVHEVVDEAMELTGRQTSLEHIALKKDYLLDVPCVFVNREALSKVFINVALNACQAMNGRGVLKITTAREGNWLRVIFQDSGVGIKKEDLHKVFDPFFSTKEVGKGAGLGLSVCVGIVKSHDGDMTVQSDGEGRGTTVTIMLPIEKRGGYEKESR